MARGKALKAARRQAQAEAAVRFDPQQRVLLDALGTARQEEVRAVNSAKGTSSALSAAIRGARKPLAQGYADAARTATAARGDLLGHLASLGAPAAPFSAAVAREQAGVTSRAAQERANALGELTLRGVQAKEGRASSIQNAHQTYATDAGSIYRQLIGTAQDRGTFTAAQIGDIRQAQRTVNAQNFRANLQARTSTANSRRTARTSRRNTDVRAHQSDVNSQRTARAKKAAAAAKPKKNPVTRSTSSHAIDQINLAVQTIHTYRPHQSSHTLRQWLVSGPTLKDASGNKSKIPRITGAGGISAHDLINAAFDVATFGTLSRQNRIALRGTHLPAAWKRPLPGRRTIRRTGQQARHAFTF